MGVYTTINDSSVYFQTKIYTGTGNTSTSYTNDGNADLQPDLLWNKNRSTSTNHILVDSILGVTKNLRPDVTDGLGTNSNFTKSFDTDGFAMGDSARVGTNGDLYCAWQWKINGGTTSSVGVGSITTTVQVNTTAGISIARYQGNGVNGATIGHGLGKIPKVVIVKGEEGSESWQIFHGARNNPEQKFLELDANSTGGTNANRWSNTAPTNSIINLGNGNSVNYSGRMFRAYSFAEIQGYSHFGKYKGSGNSDGPFIYTGFKPAWVMIKRVDSSGNWYIYDTERNGSSGSNTNQAHRILYANDSSGEVNNSDRGIDMVSNGFKVRNTLGDTNADGGTYMYWAFASSPFVSSAGVPTVAR